MPVIVRHSRLLSSVVVFAALFWPTTVFSLVVDEGAAPDQSSAEDTQKPSATSGAPAGGDLPEDPREAYRIKQRRMVQQLRRMNKSLLTPEIILEYKNNFRDYRNLVRAGVNPRRPAEIKILRTGIRYRLYQMSDLTIQQDPLAIENALKTMRREMSQAGSGISNSQQKRQFRELFFKEMLPPIRELLQNNLIARSCAIELLPDMVVVPAGIQGTRLVMQDDVDDILIEVLNDSEQPDAIKVRACNSISNYLQKHEAIPQIQIAFADAVAGQLRNPWTDLAYQVSLLSCFEDVSAPRRLVSPNDPVCFCTCGRLIQDRDRDLLVRCHAAAVFGRSGFDTQTDFGIVAWAVAELASETAVKYKEGDQRDWKWKACAWNLYRAFHHWDEQEKDGKSPGYPKGMLNRASRNKRVNDAWTAVLPVLVPMFSQEAIPNRDLLNLLQWTDANRPASLKYDPQCQPFASPADNG